jgi:hypothetical protein
LALLDELGEAALVIRAHDREVERAHSVLDDG